MIEELLPACVACSERRADSPNGFLFEEERALIATSVQKRRNEFTTARVCARDALQKLGVPPAPILTGERGEPLWPAGVLGSITHCHGYRAAVLARAQDMLALGIDAEPNAPLPEGLIEDIARPEELPRLASLRSRAPEVHWDRLLFSAKESIYKAWFPLTRRWLGFEDATVAIDPDAGTFHAQLLLAPVPTEGGPLSTFSGRWMQRGGILLSAIAWTRPAAR